MRKIAAQIILIFLFLNNAFSQNTSQVIADSLDKIRQQEFLKLADPATGQIPYGELEKAREVIAKSKGAIQPKSAISPTLTWYERGPNNNAGNIKCITRDPNDATGKKYWAGAANGGLWYNNDITDANSLWNQITGGDNWASINISSIVFNPTNSQEMYVATGDYFESGSAVGSGIYKSIDGGVTFVRLSSTIPNSNIIGTIGYAFRFANKIVMSASGVLFANTWNGLLKSSDGGATWTFLLNGQVGSDIEIGNDGIIYAAFGYVANSSKIYRSNDAIGNTWSDISPNSAGFRTEIALANSVNQSSQIMYAFAKSGGWFSKSVDGGTNWTTSTIPLVSNNTFYSFASGIAMVVDPNNPNVIIAAGNYLVKSIDGGVSWLTNFNSFGGINGIIIGNDVSSFVFCTDTGINYSSDYGNQTTGTLNYSSRNTGMRGHKSKNVAMPNIAEDGAIMGGGYKVNSNLHSLGNSSNSGFGSFSTMSFIDQDEPNIVISGGTLYNANLTYITSLSNYGNIVDYDSQNNIYYTFREYNYQNTTTVFEKVAAVGTTNTKSTFAVPTFITPIFLKAGKIANTLFLGSDQGKLYKITNIDASPVATRIDNNQLPNLNTSLSSIDVGLTENEILVTFSNFGVNSVWYTTDGGTTWVNKDASGHGLPNIPVWQAKLVRYTPSDAPKVVLATELGVFSTNNIQDSNPAWESSSTGLPNVRCNWIYFRSADSVLAVATQGRGFFTSPMRGFVNPSLNISFSKPVLCKSGSTTVAFSSFGTFPVGTNFNVELSNSSGGFASPIIIGTGTSSPISITLPANIASSANYKLRVVTVQTTPKVSNESSVFKINSTNEIYVYIAAPPNGLTQFCNGASLNLTGQVSNGSTGIFGTNYSWNGPNGFTSTSQSLILTNASASQSGVYTVSSTIESCQTYTSTSNITLVNTPSLSISATNFICPSSTISLNGIPNTASSSISYSWSGPNNFTSTLQNTTIPNATLSSGGVYTLTANFTGCSTTVTATKEVVVSNSLPAFIYGTGANCTGSTLTLNSGINTNTNGLTYSYSWVGPNSYSSTLQNISLSNMSASKVGIYTVTITYTGTCSGSATATYNVTTYSPAIYISSGSTQYCSGATTNLNVYLGTAGVTTQFSWTGPNGYTSTGNVLSIPNFTSSNAGTYVVTASYSGACNGSATASYNLTISSPSINLTGDNSYCVGTTANIVATLSVAGLSTQYSWTGPNGFTSTGNTLNIPNFAVSNAGIYTVTASYTGNCNGTITATINLGAFSPYLYISGDNYYCTGATTNLSANLNVSGLTAQYLWAGPNNFSSTASSLNISNFTAANVGTYSIIVTYSGSCNGSVSTTTSLQISTPSISVYQNGNKYCEGVNANLNLSYQITPNSFSWTGPNNFTISDASIMIPSIDASKAGIYTVTSIFSNGCNATLTATASVLLTTAIPPFYIGHNNYTSDYCFNTGSASMSLRNSVNFSENNISNVSWVGSNGFNTNGGINLNLSLANLSNSGTYTATITFAGCVGTASATTSVNISTQPQITPLIFTDNSTSLLNNVSACEGNYLYILFIANNYQNNNATIYDWTGPNSFSLNGNYNFQAFLPPLNANIAGVYTVTASLTGACAGTVTSTVQLTFNNSVPPEISITPENFVVGQPVTLSASNCAGSILWNDTNNSTNPFIFTPIANQTFSAKCVTPGCISGNSKKILFNDCTNNLNIGNTFINTITRYESSNTISATNKIIPVSNITYDAQKSVILNPGFEVKAGSVFKAQIDGCGNN